MRSRRRLSAPVLAAAMLACALAGCSGVDTPRATGPAAGAATPPGPKPVAAATAAGYTGQPALTRVIVGRGDVSVPGREAVVAQVEVGPGGVAGWHTHPGEEISYVIEGESTLLVAGQKPRTIRAGETFIIPAGVVHAARNDSPRPTRLVGVYVVEKGQPLATPASAPAP